MSKEVKPSYQLDDTVEMPPIEDDVMATEPFGEYWTYGDEPERAGLRERVVDFLSNTLHIGRREK